MNTGTCGAWDIQTKCKLVVPVAAQRQHLFLINTYSKYESRRMKGSCSFRSKLKGKGVIKWIPTRAVNVSEQCNHKYKVMLMCAIDMFMYFISVRSVAWCLATDSDGAKRPHSARGAITAEAFFQQHAK